MFDAKFLWKLFREAKAPKLQPLSYRACVAFFVFRMGHEMADKARQFRGRQMYRVVFVAFCRVIIRLLSVEYGK